MARKLSIKGAIQPTKERKYRQSRRQAAMKQAVRVTEKKLNMDIECFFSMSDSSTVDASELIPDL